MRTSSERVRAASSAWWCSAVSFLERAFELLRRLPRLRAHGAGRCASGSAAASLLGESGAQLVAALPVQQQIAALAASGAPARPCRGRPGGPRRHRRPPSASAGVCGAQCRARSSAATRRVSAAASAAPSLACDLAVERVGALDLRPQRQVAAVAFEERAASSRETEGRSPVSGLRRSRGALACAAEEMHDCAERRRDGASNRQRNGGQAARRRGLSAA